MEPSSCSTEASSNARATMTSTSAAWTRLRYSPGYAASPSESIRRGRQVDVRDLGRHYPLRPVDGLEGVEAVVRDLDHAHVGLGAPAVPGNLRRAARHRVEDRALAAPGQPDYRQVHSPTPARRAPAPARP